MMAQAQVRRFNGRTTYGGYRCRYQARPHATIGALRLPSTVKPWRRTGPSSSCANGLSLAATAQSPHGPTFSQAQTVQPFGRAQPCSR